MRAYVAFGVLIVAIATAGCSSGDGPEKKEQPPMKVEDTAFGDLVGTQDQARDRANAAVELHREALDSRLEADEGAPPAE